MGTTLRNPDENFPSGKYVSRWIWMLVFYILDCWDSISTMPTEMVFHRDSCSDEPNPDKYFSVRNLSGCINPDKKFLFPDGNLPCILLKTTLARHGKLHYMVQDRAWARFTPGQASCFLGNSFHSSRL